MTLLISYAIVPLYLSLLYLKGTKLSIFSAKVVIFLQKWSFYDFPAKEKLCLSFPAEFFVCLKMGDFKQCIFIHIIQVCKTIFSAGFHEAKAPSSICLQYRLYTNTQKVYESIPFISLNFSSPPIRGRHRFIPPRGDFPPFRSSKIYRVSMKKKYVPRKIKNPSGKGRKYTFVYGASERRGSEDSPWDTPSV